MAGNETWTIKRILDWTRDYLERKGDEHPRLSAEWLLSNATGLSRVELYTNFDKPLMQEELDRMHKGVERRAAGEPLQYVTGEMPFRHIILSCSRGVLIPRPETEILVDCALERLDAMEPARAVRPADPPVEQKALGAYAPEEQGSMAPDSDAMTSQSDMPVPGEEPADADGTAPVCVDDPSAEAAAATPPFGPDMASYRVLEVGTGTGCIALSIASERPGTYVVATDISPDAIALATRNRDALGLKQQVELVQCDLASGVDAQLAGGFDLFISNPPYIPTAVMRVIPDEVVDFEPELALDGGADGLDMFRRELEIVPAMLKPGGAFCVELYEESLDAAAQLVREQGGWSSIEVFEDLTHRPRVLVAVREG